MVVRDEDGISRPILKVFVRDAGNALREIQTIKIRDSGAVLRTPYQAFASAALSVSPSVANGTGYSRTPITVTTNSVTVATAGGQGPYSHVWTNPDPDWSAVNATSATTSFRCRVTAGNDSSTTFTDTVTDGTGSVASISVPAYVVNNYDL